MKIRFDRAAALAAALGFLAGTVYVGAAKAATSTLGPAVADIQIVQLDENCRLVRQVAKATVPHARPAASTPRPKAKPRKRLYRTDPPPVEEVICDDGAITPLSSLPVEPEPDFTPIPPESFARLSSYDLVPPVVEPSPITHDGPLAQPSWLDAGIGVYLAGPSYRLLPSPSVAHITPIPEPAGWALMGAGIVLLVFRQAVWGGATTTPASAVDRGQTQAPCTSVWGSPARPYAG